ncbi:GTP-binding protein, HflX [Actinidia rufa]|uniref:GTP-binding protein, HflX n=1 Tax=Actinidia rufa TaxID=165716 RepID=A0A7J0GI00_9ERIC|nr:GTP-binding protein, HflX [Actinidia rufa]
MSACSFCSVTRPLPLITKSGFPSRNPDLNRTTHFTLRRDLSKNSWRIARVIQEEEVGILSPDDTISLRTPVLETGEEREVDGVVDGVAETLVEEEEERTPNSSRRYAKKGEDEEEDRYDARFKLRNGREVFEEKAYLVGVERKDDTENSFGTEESLKELAQLADTAGLMVVGSTYQKLATPNPRTYIGSGKVAEIKMAINALGAETVIFDDELSAGLVALAQMEYQLPRLTKMWTHLERQAGGRVKGMGEKQIEVDKRILRTQIGDLKKELESVGYTNAGKSTLLNQLTGAKVLAEDRLFATLDPTTRRVQMKNGKEFLLTDTVGFIQKLPTTLVAAFRATLEEIAESSLLVHVVDIRYDSHPLAEQQIDAVDKVLAELDVSSIPKLTVWNKVDKASDPLKIKLEAQKREDTVCISALSGGGLDEFCNAVQEKLKDSMVWVEALIPFDKGEFLSTIHNVGMVERTEYKETGTLVRAYVPLRFARLLTPMRQLRVS